MEADCCQSITCHSANDQSAKTSEESEISIWQLGIALVIIGQAMVFGLGINMTPPEYDTGIYWFLHGGLCLSSLVVMALLGGSLFKESWNALVNKRLQVELLFLFSLLGALSGSVIASVSGKGDVYYEVVAIVLVVYSVGKIIRIRSRKKAIEASRKAQNDFDFAYIIDKQGNKKRVNLSEVGCCCEVIVGPGDAVTVDGIILSGEGYVKETAITGELEPACKKKAEFILAGSYSVDGTFKIKPTGLKGQRRLDSILNTVANAQLRPSALQDQANRVVQWFLPLVVSISVFAFILGVRRYDILQASLNSMSVLLVACPCALGLATPIAVWSGLWKLSTLGIVSRSGELLDTLSRVDRIIFDKTGTLSEESLKVVGMNFSSDLEVTSEALLGIIQSVELSVEHPVARAIKGIRNNKEANCYEVEKMKLVPGKGISSEVFDREKGTRYELKMGEITHMRNGEDNFWKENENRCKKCIYVSLNEKPAGVIYLDEKMREGLEGTLEELKRMGIKGTILTGDSSGRYTEIEGIKVYSGLSPKEKETYAKEYIKKGEHVLFIGDGVNDASGMAVSHGSLAMGEGVDLVNSTASGVLVGKSLEVLPKGIKICKNIRQKIMGNLVFATTYNTLGMSLAAMGKLHPVFAALLMLISSVFVSVRALKSVNIELRK